MSGYGSSFYLLCEGKLSLAFEAHLFLYLSSNFEQT